MNKSLAYLDDSAILEDHFSHTLVRSINNFLVPLVIGSKVRINALVSIVGVLVGGALAGISGMFLSIPAIAMMKVVFDRVDGLKPWGILLGDQTPEQANSKLFGLVRRKVKDVEE